MARDLEKITLAYWAVRMAVHHPTHPGMSGNEAFDLLREEVFLRPTDWRLRAAMHEISFDIVEGNTEWREERQVAGSVSTLRTRD